MNRINALLTRIGLWSTKAKLEFNIEKIDKITETVAKAKKSASNTALSSITLKRARISKLEAEIVALNDLINEIG